MKRAVPRAPAPLRASVRDVRQCLPNAAPARDVPPTDVVEQPSLEGVIRILLENGAAKAVLKEDCSLAELKATCSYIRAQVDAHCTTLNFPLSPVNYADGNDTFLSATTRLLERTPRVTTIQFVQMARTFSSTWREWLSLQRAIDSINIFNHTPIERMIIVAEHAQAVLCLPRACVYELCVLDPMLPDTHLATWDNLKTLSLTMGRDTVPSLGGGNLPSLRDLSISLRGYGALQQFAQLDDVLGALTKLRIGADANAGSQWRSFKTIFEKLKDVEVLHVDGSIFREHMLMGSIIDVPYGSNTHLTDQLTGIAFEKLRVLKLTNANAQFVRFDGIEAPLTTLIIRQEGGAIDAASIAAAPWSSRLETLVIGSDPDEIYAIESGFIFMRVVNALTLSTALRSIHTLDLGRSVVDVPVDEMCLISEWSGLKHLTLPIISPIFMPINIPMALLCGTWPRLETVDVRGIELALTQIAPLCNARWPNLQKMLLHTFEDTETATRVHAKLRAAFPQCAFIFSPEPLEEDSDGGL